MKGENVKIDVKEVKVEHLIITLKTEEAEAVNKQFWIFKSRYLTLVNQLTPDDYRYDEGLQQLINFFLTLNQSVGKVEDSEDIKVDSEF